MVEALRRASPGRWVWLCIAGLALFELVAQLRISAEVPTEHAWEEASAYVRAQFEDGDRIVASPGWTDPIVRRHLGDLLSLRAAAPGDVGGARRTWELGIRGASAREAVPDLERAFEEVTVRMWQEAADSVLFDFVDHIDVATVELVGSNGGRACPWTTSRPDRGGLFRGPMTPTERFVCDPKRPWLWVGATVMADLGLQPRRCVWQHPAGASPVRVSFTDVAIGDRLSLRAGIDYSNERWRRGAPVTLRVWIADRLATELVHRDGDGWAGVDIDTSELGVERADVRFETTTEDSTARLFCWAASTRKGQTDE